MKRLFNKAIWNNIKEKGTKLNKKVALLAMTGVLLIAGGAVLINSFKAEVVVSEDDFNNYLKLRSESNITPSWGIPTTAGVANGGSNMQVYLGENEQYYYDKDKGKYAGIFTPENNGAYAYIEDSGYYKYVGPGEGTHAGSFTYVGEGNGEYSRELKELSWWIAKRPRTTEAASVPAVKNAKREYDAANEEYEKAVKDKEEADNLKKEQDDEVAAVAEKAEIMNKRVYYDYQSLVETDSKKQEAWHQLAYDQYLLLGSTSNYVSGEFLWSLANAVCNAHNTLKEKMDEFINKKNAGLSAEAIEPYYSAVDDAYKNFMTKLNEFYSRNEVNKYEKRATGGSWIVTNTFNISEVNAKVSQAEAERDAAKAKFDEVTNLYNNNLLTDNAPEMTLLATDTVLDNQVFNTYEDARTVSSSNKFGDYTGNTTIYAGFWVTSSVRAYFGRNQGGFPGTYNSRTGKYDATAGTIKSDFESQYLTDSIIKNINSYKSSGWTDNYSIPYYKSTDNQNIFLFFNSSVADSIPKNYLPKGKDIWLRNGSSGNTNEAYANWDGSTLTTGYANVSEHKGYLPITKYSLTKGGSTVTHIAQMRGRTVEDPGIMKEVTKTSDELKQGPYYLKYSDINNQASLNISAGSNIFSNAKLKIPYQSVVKEAYVVLYLRNTTSGKTFGSAVKILNNEGGTIEFDLSDVPTGDYEAYAWIERSEDGLDYIVQDGITFNLYRGNDILFEESNQVKYLDQNGDEITEIYTKGDKNYKIDGVRNNLTYRFILEVDDAYSKDNLDSKVIYEILGTNSSVAPIKNLKPYAENPGKNQNARPLDASDEQAFKKYWVCEIDSSVNNNEKINNEPMQIKVSVSNLDINRYTLQLAARFAGDPYYIRMEGLKNVIDNTAANLVGQYTHGSYAVFSLKLGSAYEGGNQGLKVKALRKEWLNEDGNIINEEEYNNTVPLILGGNSLGGPGVYTLENIQHDTVIWIDDLKKTEYNIYFESEKEEGKSVDLNKAIEITNLVTYENDKPKPPQNLASLFVTIEHGSPLTFDLGLKNGYEVPNEELLVAKFVPEGSGKTVEIKPTKSDGKYHFDFSTEDDKGVKEGIINSRGKIVISGIEAKVTEAEFVEIPLKTQVETQYKGGKKVYPNDTDEKFLGTSEYGDKYEFKIRFDASTYQSYSGINQEDILIKAGDYYEFAGKFQGKYNADFVNVGEDNGSYVVNKEIAPYYEQSEDEDASYVLEFEDVGENQGSYAIGEYYKYSTGAEATYTLKFENVGENKGSYTEVKEGETTYYKYVGKNRGQYEVSQEPGTEGVKYKKNTVYEYVGEGNGQYEVKGDPEINFNADVRYKTANFYTHVGLGQGSFNITNVREVGDGKGHYNLNDYNDEAKSEEGKIYKSEVERVVDENDAAKSYVEVKIGEFKNEKIESITEYGLSLKIKIKDDHIQVNNYEVNISSTNSALELHSECYYVEDSVNGTGVRIEEVTDGSGKYNLVKEINSYEYSEDKTGDYDIKFEYVNKNQGNYKISENGIIQNTGHGAYKKSESGNYYEYSEDKTGDYDIKFEYAGENQGNYKISENGITENTGSGAYKEKDVINQYIPAESGQYNITEDTSSTTKYRRVGTAEQISSIQLGATNNVYYKTNIEHGNVKYFRIEGVDLDNLNIETDGKSKFERIGSTNIFKLSDVTGNSDIMLSFGEVFVKIKPKGPGIKLADIIDIYRGEDANGENITEYLTYFSGIPVDKDSDFKFTLVKKDNVEGYGDVTLADLKLYYNAEIDSEGNITSGTKIEGTPIENSGKDTLTFALLSVSQDIEIIIDGIELNGYTLTLPNLEKKIKYEVLTEGFLMIPTADEDGYEVSNIKHNLDVVKIRVDAMPGFKFEPDSGNEIFSINEKVGDKEAAVLQVEQQKENDTVYYILTVSKMISDAALEVNGSLIMDDYHTVSITLPTGIEIVSVSGHEFKEVSSSDSISQYNVSLETNGMLRFSLFSDMHDTSTFEVTKKNVDNGVEGMPQTVSPIEGVYYISDAGCDQRVNITAKAFNSSSVSFVMEDQSIKKSEAIKLYTLKDANSEREEQPVDKNISVGYNQTLYFSIESKGKYHKSNPVAKVKNEDGSYTNLRQEYKKSDANNPEGYYYFILDKVTGDTEVIISEVTIDKYEVIFEGDNVNFISDDFSNLNEMGQILEYGENFSFMVAPEAGYDIRNINITIKGIGSDPLYDETKTKVSVVDKDSGRYILENITGDIAIIVGNVEERKYNVTFQEVGDLVSNGDVKFDITATRGGTDPTDIPVEKNTIQVGYSEMVVVTVKLRDKYDKSNITLELSDDKLGKIEEKSNENGEFEYSIYVIDDVNIYVKNLAVNNHTIGFDYNNTVEIYDPSQNVILDLGETQSVQYGKSYSFRIKAAEGYNLQSAEGKVTAKYTDRDGNEQTYDMTLTESGGYYKYTIKEVNRDTTVVIDPLDKLKYSIKMDNNNVEYFDENSTSTNLIKLERNDEGYIVENKDGPLLYKEHDSDFSFKIKAIEGYSIDKVSSGSVKTDNGNIVEVSEQDPEGFIKITVENIKNDTVVIISDVNPNEYDVTFNITDTETDPDKQYPELQNSLTIFDDSGNDITGKGMAIHGKIFKFRIQLKEAYSQSAIEVKIEKEGAELGEEDSDDGNKYYTLDLRNSSDLSGFSIDELLEGINIYINNVKRNQYTITFDGVGAVVKNSNLEEVYGYNESASDYAMKGEAKIAHSYGENSGKSQNDDYTFRLYADKERGFELDTQTPITIYSNSGTVSEGIYYPKNGENDDYYLYTLSGVTSDPIVYIEGVKSTFYKLTFEGNIGGTEGFTIKRDGNDITSGIYLPYGDTVEFNVELKEGYTKSQISLTLGRDGTPIEFVGDKYTFTQRDEECTIFVNDLAVNNYRVEFNADEKDKSNYKDSDGRICESFETEIFHNANGVGENNKTSYTFRVMAKAGYSVKNAQIKVTNDDINLSGSGEKTYAKVTITNASENEITVTLSDVTSDISIDVIEVEQKLYNLTFSAPGGSVTVTHYTGRDITEGMQVSYGQIVRFKVSLNEGYTMSSITLTASKGVTIDTDETDGYYTIKNMPSDDVNVEIDGVKKNEYNIRFSSDEGKLSDMIQIYENAEKTDENERPLNFDNYSIQKEHGEEYKFRIKAKPGYVVQDIKVLGYDADVELSYDYSNDWMLVALSNIRGIVNESGETQKDIRIDISGIKKNKYKVTFENEGEESSTISHISILGGIYSGDPQNASLKNITNLGQEVPYNSQLIFKIMPSTGYDRAFIKEPGNPNSNVIITAGGKPLAWEGISDDTKSFSEGYIITDPITDNLTISISGVTINQYSVNLTGDYVDFYKPVGDEKIPNSKGIANHGSDLSFKVKPQEGYDLSKMGIESTVGELVEESKSDYEAIYSLKNITDDATIKVKIDKSKIELKLEEGEGFKYQEYDLNTGSIADIRGIQVVEHGDDFEFMVMVEHGYDPKTLKVYQDGNALTPEKSQSGDEENLIRYKISKVSADCTITASVSKMKYDIKLQSIEGLSYYENGIEVNNSSLLTAEYGSSFQFSIKLDSKHNQSPIEVFANGEKLDLINGVYTIADISGNIDITVQNVEVNKYKINLTSGVGVQYNVVSGGSTITQESGVHVREYGDSISFSISPLEGYETSNMVVAVKEIDGTTKALTASGGMYTISNITGDKTVIVEEAAMIQYTLTLQTTAGVTYMNDSGAIIENFVKVTHGSNFEFTINLSEAYDESVPIVISTGKTGVTKLATGRYMISNVTEDTTIMVNNVVKNTYTVTLTGITGVYYKDAGGKTISADQTVGYNEDFTFGVGLHSAYSDSEITVMVGSEEVAAEDNGLYRITGILENKTVTVVGVDENAEVDVVNLINALPDKVRDAADVSAVVNATKAYNALPEEKRGNVTNIGKLQDLQRQSGEFSHTTNDITVSGVDWNIKLVAVPLSSSTEEHERIYDQLDSEFILSLYDIYLYDMLTDKRYELPEGQKVIVTIPTPDLTYFENPFIIHEKSSDGKLEYLLMTRDGSRTSFEMTSFSPVGMAATKSLGTGYSSLYEGLNSGMEPIKDGIYDIMQTGIKSKKLSFQGGSIGGNKTSSETEEESESISDFVTGNNTQNSFAQGNSNTKGSALRLLFVIILGFTITGIVAFIVRKNNEEKSQNQKSKK